MHVYVYVYPSTLDIDVKLFFVKHPHLTCKIMPYWQKINWICNSLEDRTI